MRYNWKVCSRFRTTVSIGKMATECQVYTLQSGQIQRSPVELECCVASRAGIRYTE